MSQPLISVIIPVYNMENYLVQCLESVTKQNFEDYEIIIVNDGSTDSSDAICKYYAKKENSRTKVIHKKNGGLSDARNVGLENISGRYVIFLDSDDYWNDENFLIKIAKIIWTVNPDVIIFGYQKVSGDKVISKHIPLKNSKTIEELVKDGEFNICAWDKVVRTRLLTQNNIRFKTGVFSEDMEWCARIFNSSHTCAVLREASHSYRQRNSSITKNISLKNISDVYENLITCVELKNTMNAKKKEVYDVYLSQNFSMLIIDISQIEKSKAQKYNEFIKKNLHILKKSKRKREKIIYYCVKFLGLSNTEILLRKIWRIKFEKH